MIYLIIGLAIMLLIIIISSIRASNKPVNIKYQTPEAPEAPEPEYITEKLYKVRLSSDLGTANLENVVSVKKGENFITFTNKDGKKINYKNEHIISYILEETGSYKKEVEYKIFYGPHNTFIRRL